MPIYLFVFYRSKYKLCPFVFSRDSLKIVHFRRGFVQCSGVILQQSLNILYVMQRLRSGGWAQYLARWAGKMISLSAGLRMLVRGARLGENQRLGEASSPGSAHQGKPRHAALSAFSCAGHWGEKRASSSR